MIITILHGTERKRSVQLPIDLTSRQLTRFCKSESRTWTPIFSEPQETSLDLISSAIGQVWLLFPILPLSLHIQRLRYVQRRVLQKKKSNIILFVAVLITRQRHFRNPNPGTWKKYQHLVFARVSVRLLKSCVLYHTRDNFIGLNGMHGPLQFSQRERHFKSFAELQESTSFIQLKFKRR